MNVDLYVLATNDRFELPLFVADSVKELAQKADISEANIRSAITKKQRVYNRAGKKYKLYRIKVSIQREDYL
jgi:hypothetical protein